MSGNWFFVCFGGLVNDHHSRADDAIVKIYFLSNVKLQRLKQETIFPPFEEARAHKRKKKKERKTEWKKSTMGGLTDDELLEKDLFGILGVDRKATDDEITKAYRKKARKIHPGKLEPIKPLNFWQYGVLFWSHFISPLQTLVSKSRVCGIRRARLAVCRSDCPVLPRILESLSLDRCSPYKKAKKLRSRSDRGGGFLDGRHLGNKFFTRLSGRTFPQPSKETTHIS